MISIKDYIKQILEAEEEQQVVKIKKLKVEYTTDPTSIVIVVPSNYGETDVQAYLDDVCLSTFPGMTDESKKVLGDNVKNISDAYFTYSGYVSVSTPPSVINIEWDSKYDDNNISEEYTYFTLKNVKYNMEFSEFNLSNLEDDSTEKIDEALAKIFESLQSNSINSYPIDIEYASSKYELE